MGAFYQEAAAKLIDYDPQRASSVAVPTLQMPHAWDSFTTPDQNEILAVMGPLLQSRGAHPRSRRKEGFRTLRASTACGCSSASRAKPRLSAGVGLELLQRSIPDRRLV